MKLLNRPERIVSYIELGSHAQRIPGRADISNVDILLPTSEDDKALVWNKLKYGNTCDFVLGKKINILKFQDAGDEIILYGVIPISSGYNLGGEGTVFECKIDHYEVIPGG